MEKYDQLMIVGEGSYGSVMKCRHRETGQIVAIKKFLDTEEELIARRMAMREIRMLKKLRHENLVCLIEVFRVRKRFHIVFEFVDRTVLDELEECGGEGLEEQLCRERIFQVIRAVRFCHIKHIIHRDVKPENVLVSQLGVVKLCDFGFARLLGSTGEPCTEYVATRWYRAPELLVGDVHYGPAVDVWAIGCLFSEMMSGKPLFPGDSDIDQLFRICKLLGQPCYRHQVLIAKNPNFKGMLKSSTDETIRALLKIFPHWSSFAIDFLAVSMKMDPTLRSTTEELIHHPYLNHDKFVEKYLPKLRQKVLQEYQDNPLVRKYQAEIIAASDDLRQELFLEKLKKSSHVPRWKINIQDPYIKRKTSYISFTSFQPSETKSQSEINKSFITPPTSETEKNNSPFNSFKLNGGFNKLDQRSKKSTDSILDVKNESSEAILNESIMGFDSPTNVSAQTEHNMIPSNSYYTNLNVLHPTVNALNFSMKETPQKRPPCNPKIKDSKMSIKNIQSRLNKSPVPLIHPPSDYYIKQTSKGLALDMGCGSGGVNENVYQNNLKAQPPWLSTSGYRTYRKDTVEQTTWTKLDHAINPNVYSSTADQSYFPSLTGGSPLKKKKNPPFITPFVAQDNNNNNHNTPKNSVNGRKRKLEMRISPH